MAGQAQGGRRSVVQRAIGKDRQNSILVTGYAQLPEAEGKSGQFGVTLEVDPHTDTILAAECSCHSELGRDWFTKLLIGRSLTEELPEIMEDFENRCAVPAQKSIVRSLQNANNRYREFKLAHRPAAAARLTSYRVHAPAMKG